uniref:Uncharacterized protein n=1 Tax=Arundo donax TaxID=35708 RepID=A0A0A9CDE7_ARUDO
MTVRRSQLTPTMLLPPVPETTARFRRSRRPGSVLNSATGRGKLLIAAAQSSSSSTADANISLRFILKTGYA